MTDAQIDKSRKVETRKTGVLLTGCTGSIGAHLTRQLLAEGYNVYAIVRDRDKLVHNLRGCARDRLTILHADLLCERELEQLGQELKSIPGFDFVIHTVGGGPLTSSAKFASSICDLNYKTTVNLVYALEDAGKLASISAFLYFSSLAAMGIPNSTTTVLYHETSACSPVLPYEQAKFRTEEFLQGLTKKYNLKVVILRFPQIYGSDDDPFMRMINLIRRGVFPVVRNRIGTLPLLHVIDAVNATCRVLDDVSAIRENYDVLLICENSYSFRYFEQLVRRKYHRGGVIAVPYPVMYLAILAIEILFKAWGRPEPLNRHRLKSMTKNRVVDCRKFAETFKFKFDHNVETFIADHAR